MTIETFETLRTMKKSENSCSSIRCVGKPPLGVRQVIRDCMLFIICVVYRRSIACGAGLPDEGLQRLRVPGWGRLVLCTKTMREPSRLWLDAHVPPELYFWMASMCRIHDIVALFLMSLTFGVFHSLIGWEPRYAERSSLLLIHIAYTHD